MQLSLKHVFGARKHHIPGHADFGAPAAPQVIVHLGDGWGRGCEGEVEWEVLCSLGRLSSAQCPGGPITNVSGLTAKRDKAVAAALTKSTTKGAASGGEASKTVPGASAAGTATLGNDPASITAKATPPPAQPAVGLQRRNIFGTFQAWLKQQGGQESLAALVAAADTRQATTAPPPPASTNAAPTSAPPPGATTAASPAVQGATSSAVQSTDGLGTTAATQPAVSVPGSTASPPAQEALLDMEEVLRLLRKAVPNCSTLEGQLFMAMVDINHDGQLSLSELTDAMKECNDLNAAILGKANAKDKRADVEADLVAVISTLRGRAPELDGLLAAAAAKEPSKGWVQFQDLSSIFQAMMPGGNRAMVRALLAHIARTANIAPTDPGLTPAEIRKALGLPEPPPANASTQAASAAPAGSPDVSPVKGGAAAGAAVAAGFVPGRRRDLFKLLRHHLKNNRVQVEALFPSGTSLTLAQLRKVVRALLESRAGEAPPSGREMRALVALLDVNNNGVVSREEFEGGLKECRELSSEVSKFQSDPASITLSAPVSPAAPDSPTWGQLLDAMKGLAAGIETRRPYVESLVKSLDTRGKGRLDLVQIRTLLVSLAPEMGSGPMRCLLAHFDLWDPSTHALLGLKHVLMALELQPAPASLYPKTSGLPGAGGEDEDDNDNTALQALTGSPGVLPRRLPALPNKLQRAVEGLTAALPSSRGTGSGGLLPTPQQWQAWHSNVRTPYRKSGAVRLGGASVTPHDPKFWAKSWDTHIRWLQQMPMAQQQAASQAPLGAVPGTGPALANNNLLSSLAGAVPGKLTSSLQKEAGRLPDKKGTAGEAGIGKPKSTASSAKDTASTPQGAPAPPSGPQNVLEERPWPDIPVTAIPFLGATTKAAESFVPGLKPEPEEPAFVPPPRPVVPPPPYAALQKRMVRPTTSPSPPGAFATAKQQAPAPPPDAATHAAAFSHLLGTEAPGPRGAGAGAVPDGTRHTSAATPLSAGVLAPPAPASTQAVASPATAAAAAGAGAAPVALVSSVMPAPSSQGPGNPGTAASAQPAAPSQTQQGPAPAQTAAPGGFQTAPTVAGTQPGPSQQAVQDAQVASSNPPGQGAALPPPAPSTAPPAASPAPQPATATPPTDKNNSAATKEEQPGFFGRLFGKGKKPDAAPSQGPTAAAAPAAAGTAATGSIGTPSAGAPAQTGSTAPLPAPDAPAQQGTPAQVANPTPGPQQQQAAAAATSAANAASPAAASAVAGSATDTKQGSAAAAVPGASSGMQAAPTAAAPAAPSVPPGSQSASAPPGPGATPATAASQDKAAPTQGPGTMPIAAGQEKAAPGTGPAPAAGAPAGAAQTSTSMPAATQPSVATPQAAPAGAQPTGATGASQALPPSSTTTSQPEAPVRAEALPEKKPGFFGRLFGGKGGDDKKAGDPQPPVGLPTTTQPGASAQPTTAQPAQQGPSAPQQTAPAQPSVLTAAQSAAAQKPEEVARAAGAPAGQPAPGGAQPSGPPAASVPAATVPAGSTAVNTPAPASAPQAPLASQPPPQLTNTPPTAAAPLSSQPPADAPAPAATLPSPPNAPANVPPPAATPQAPPPPVQQPQPVSEPGKKPGFFGRLFGGKGDNKGAGAAAAPATPASGTTPAPAQQPTATPSAAAASAPVAPSVAAPAPASAPPAANPSSAQPPATAATSASPVVGSTPAPQPQAAAAAPLSTSTQPASTPAPAGTTQRNTSATSNAAPIATDTIARAAPSPPIASQPTATSASTPAPGPAGLPGQSGASAQPASAPPPQSLPAAQPSAAAPPQPAPPIQPPPAAGSSASPPTPGASAVQQSAAPAAAQPPAAAPAPVPGPSAPVQGPPASVPSATPLNPPTKPPAPGALSVPSSAAAPVAAQPTPAQAGMPSTPPLAPAAPASTTPSATVRSSTPPVGPAPLGMPAPGAPPVASSSTAAPPAATMPQSTVSSATPLRPVGPAPPGTSTGKTGPVVASPPPPPSAPAPPPPAPLPPAWSDSGSSSEGEDEGGMTVERVSRPAGRFGSVQSSSRAVPWFGLSGEGPLLSWQHLSAMQKQGTAGPVCEGSEDPRAGQAPTVPAVPAPPGPVPPVPQAAQTAVPAHSMPASTPAQTKPSAAAAAPTGPAIVTVNATLQTPAVPAAGNTGSATPGVSATAASSPAPPPHRQPTPSASAAKDAPAAPKPGLGTTPAAASDAAAAPASTPPPLATPAPAAASPVPNAAATVSPASTLNNAPVAPQPAASAALTAPLAATPVPAPQSLPTAPPPAAAPPQPAIQTQPLPAAGAPVPASPPAAAAAQQPAAPAAAQPPAAAQAPVPGLSTPAQSQASVKPPAAAPGAAPAGITPVPPAPATAPPGTTPGPPASPATTPTPALTKEAPAAVAAVQPSLARPGAQPAAQPAAPVPVAQVAVGSAAVPAVPGGATVTPAVPPAPVTPGGGSTSTPASAPKPVAPAAAGASAATPASPSVPVVPMGSSAAPAGAAPPVPSAQPAPSVPGTAASPPTPGAPAAAQPAPALAGVPNTPPLAPAPAPPQTSTLPRDGTAVPPTSVGSKPAPTTPTAATTSVPTQTQAMAKEPPAAAAPASGPQPAVTPSPNTTATPAQAPTVPKEAAAGAQPPLTNSQPAPAPAAPPAAPTGSSPSPLTPTSSTPAAPVPPAMPGSSGPPLSTGPPPLSAAAGAVKDTPPSVPTSLAPAAAQEPTSAPAAKAGGGAEAQTPVPGSAPPAATAQVPQRVPVPLPAAPAGADTQQTSTAAPIAAPPTSAPAAATPPPPTSQQPGAGLAPQASMRPLPTSAASQTGPATAAAALAIPAAPSSVTHTQVKASPAVPQAVPANGTPSTAQYCPVLPSTAQSPAQPSTAAAGQQSSAGLSAASPTVPAISPAQATAVAAATAQSTPLPISNTMSSAPASRTPALEAQQPVLPPVSPAPAQPPAALAAAAAAAAPVTRGATSQPLKEQGGNSAGDKAAAPPLPVGLTGGPPLALRFTRPPPEPLKEWPLKPPLRLVQTRALVYQVTALGVTAPSGTTGTSRAPGAAFGGMSGSAAAAGSDLGDVDAIVLRLPEGVTTPVYVERVEVIATPGGGRSSAPPLRWTATYRGWLVPPSGEAGNSGAAAGGVAGSPAQDAATQQPQGAATAPSSKGNASTAGPEAAGSTDARTPPPHSQVVLRPDPWAWEEWDMQESAAANRSPGPGAVQPARLSTAFYNTNLKEWTWSRPPPPPVPARPGAVPCAQPRSPYAGASPDEWLGGTHCALPRVGFRFLDNLPEVCTRVREQYGVGKGGRAGALERQVTVRGQPVRHTVTLQARGGFRVPRLLPPPLPPPAPDAPQAPAPVRSAGVPAAPTTAPPAGYVATGATGPAPVSPLLAPSSNQGGEELLPFPRLPPALPGGGLPGVLEAVVVSYDLGALRARGGGSPTWLVSEVALDDSAGALLCPVRFSVLLDDQLAWQSEWIDTAGVTQPCYVQVTGASVLRLVVETEFSGGALGVWMDPALLTGPLPAGVQGAGGGDGAAQGKAMARGRVQFCKQAAGSIMYMAPSSFRPQDAGGSGSDQARYSVILYTGDVPGGGTHGQVYIRLLGCRGMAPNLVPVASKWAGPINGTKAVERGSTVTFEVPMTDMDVVESIQIQLRGTGSLAAVASPGKLFDDIKSFMTGEKAIHPPGSGWALDMVEVVHQGSGACACFPAGGRFPELLLVQARAAAVAAGSDPESVTKPDPEATPLTLSTPAPSAGYYKVVFHQLTSGPGKGTGLNFPLSMTLMGGGVGAGGVGSGHTWSLRPELLSKAHSTLLLKADGDLGDLSRVQLSTQQQSLFNSRLQAIEVVRMSDNRQFVFSASDLAPVGTSGAAVSIPTARGSHFKIMTVTGSDPDASTDARVYIDLHGTRGQLMDLLLRDTGDTFNRGATDVFFFPGTTTGPGGLGPLTSVCISHDDSGDSPNWQLERVEVTDTGVGKTWVFPCQAWIGKDKEGVLERVLHPTNRPLSNEAGAADDGFFLVAQPPSIAALAASSKPQGDPASSSGIATRSQGGSVVGAVGSAGGGGSSIVTYHMLLQMCDRGVIDAVDEGWQAAEAVQVAGTSQEGLVVSSDVIILDSRECGFNLQVDNEYVRFMQQRALAASVPAGAHQHLPSNTGRGTAAYQVTVTVSQLYTPSQGLSSSTSWASATAPRELSLVLHGTRGTSTALPLGLSTAISSSLAVGTLPSNTSSAPGTTASAPGGPAGSTLGPLIPQSNTRGNAVLSGTTGVGPAAAAPLAVAGGVARPFTDTIHPDVFVVQWAGDQLGQLLRADLKMSQSGLGGVWGVQVLRVAVRELGAGAGGATLQGSILASSADASVVEFDAGNQWLGPAPASEMGAAGEQATGRAAVAVGTQSLRLLPAGLAAFTFNARDVGVLKTVHLRHDAPGAWPGWRLEGVQVFVSLPPGLSGPKTFNTHQVFLPTQAGATTGPYTAKQQQQQQQQGPLTLTEMLGPPGGPDALEPTGARKVSVPGATLTAGVIPERPCLYACASPADVAQSAWPNPDLPFIRHWVTREAAGFGETPGMYFVPPIITTATSGAPAPLPPVVDPLAPRPLLLPPLAVAGAAGRGGVGGIRDARQLVLEPLKAEKYREQYQAQLEALRAGHGDLCALLRYQVLTQPGLLHEWMTAVDGDHDGRVVGPEQVAQLAALALPPAEVAPAVVTDKQRAYLAAMVALDRGVGLDEVALADALKGCSHANKKATSLLRLLSEHPGQRPDLDDSLGGAELVLGGLAQRLVHEEGNQAAAAAFASLDTDGSGYLEPSELCHAFRALEQGLSDEEMRVLLAYLHLGVDKDNDGRLSAAELRTGLAPWVPGPPPLELARLGALYRAGQMGVFQLVRQAADLQPALLPALFLQHAQTQGHTPPPPVATTPPADKVAPQDAGLASAQAPASASGSTPPAPAPVSTVTAPSQAVPVPLSVPISAVPAIIAALVPASVLGPPLGTSSAGAASQAAGTNPASPPGAGGSHNQAPASALAGSLLTPADTRLLLSVLLLDRAAQLPAQPAAPGAAGAQQQAAQPAAALVTLSELQSDLVACMEAAKKAAGLRRIVLDAAAEGVLDVGLDPELGGTEVALQGLARVFGSASKADVQAAFALYDTDGSGALDTAELCACIKTISPGVQQSELRLLVAYIEMYADTGDKDGRITQDELTAALLPFASPPSSAPTTAAAPGPVDTLPNNQAQGGVGGGTMSGPDAVGGGQIAQPPAGSTNTVATPVQPGNQSAPAATTPLPSLPPPGPAAAVPKAQPDNATGGAEGPASAAAAPPPAAALSLARPAGGRGGALAPLLPTAAPSPLPSGTPDAPAAAPTSSSTPPPSATGDSKAVAPAQPAAGALVTGASPPVNSSSAAPGSLPSLLQQPTATVTPPAVPAAPNQPGLPAETSVASSNGQGGGVQPAPAPITTSAQSAVTPAGPQPRQQQPQPQAPPSPAGVSGAPGFAPATTPGGGVRAPAPSAGAV